MAYFRFCAKIINHNGFVLSTMLLAIVLVTVLTGCTTKLTATKVVASEQTVEGQVYYLPRTEFSIDLARVLKGCSSGYESDGVAVLEWLREQAEVIKHADNFRSLYEELLKAPVLKSPGMEAYLSEKLDNNWRKDLEGTNAQPGTLAGIIKDKVPTQSPMELTLEVGMQATVTPLNLLDPDQIYAIKYSGMNEGVKKTEYKVETYPNGTLRSINMALVDKTGPIVQSTLKGVATIAAAAYGVPLPTGTKELTKKKDGEKAIKGFDIWLEEKKAETLKLVSPETRLNLYQMNALASAFKDTAQKILDANEKVAKQQELVDAATKTLADEKKKQSEMNANDPGLSAQNTAVKDATAKVDTETKKLESLTKDKDALVKSSSKQSQNLAEATKKLTISAVTLLLPEDLSSASHKDGIQLEGSYEAIDSWLDSAKLNKIKERCDETQMNREDLEDFPCGIIKNLSAYAAIYPPCTKMSSTSSVSDSGSGDYSQPVPTNDQLYTDNLMPQTSPTACTGSVVYRQPAQALLVISKGEKCLKNGKLHVLQKNILLSSVVNVPQLGVLASLPLANEPFQNNNLAASFSETGALTSLTYNTNAKMEEAADTFSSSANIFSQFKSAQTGSENAKLDNAKTEADARTELLKALLEEEKAKTEFESYVKGKASPATEDSSNATP